MFNGAYSPGPGPDTPLAPDFQGEWGKFEYENVYWGLQWGSAHPGICQFVFCDGSVHALAFTMNSDVFRNLCSRNDGTPIGSQFCTACRTIPCPPNVLTKCSGCRPT